MGITDKQRHPIGSLRGCTAMFEEVGITVASKQATQKDMEKWPQYLTKLREKYRYIV